MKITVLSKWYNEELLAPLFFNHYSYVDEFIINLDRESNKKTIDIIKSNSKAKIHWSECVGGQNERLFVEEANRIASECDSDWLMYLDADEFIFPRDFSEVKDFLSRATGNVIYASMWQIYRHENDSDLDYSQKPLLQRRHGDPNRYEGYNSHYTKPVVIQPYINITWSPGHQFFEPNAKIAIEQDIVFDGSHWRLPDVNIAIQRRVYGRKFRFSEESIINGWGGQHFNVTEEEIIAEYEEHKRDPQVF